MTLRNRMLLGGTGVGFLVFIWYLVNRKAGNISPLEQMLGTGVIAAVVSQGLAWWKEHSQ